MYRLCSEQAARSLLKKSLRRWVAGVGAQSSERSPQSGEVWGLSSIDPSHPDRIFQRAAIATGEKPSRSQPRRRALLLFAMLALIGAPGLSGFSGATISLLGIFQQSGWLAIAALLGLLIVAWAVLRLWPTGLSPQSAISPDQGAGDLTLRDCAALAPIVAAIIWIGINPQFIADRIEPVRESRRPVTALDRPIRQGGDQGVRAHPSRDRDVF